MLFNHTNNSQKNKNKTLTTNEYKKNAQVINSTQLNWNIVNKCKYILGLICWGLGVTDGLVNGNGVGRLAGRTGVWICLWK